jgi:hypothetical protein
MSAEIIDIKAKSERDKGNGAREALIDLVKDLPFRVPHGVAEAWAEQVLMELWMRGFKIVKLESDE